MSNHVRVPTPKRMQRHTQRAVTMKDRKKDDRRRKARGRSFRGEW